MQRAGLHGERFHVLVVRYAQAVLLNLLDVLRPGINEGDRFASTCHIRAGISADCPCADNGDVLAHGTPPIIVLARP